METWNARWNVARAAWPEFDVTEAEFVTAVVRRTSFATPPAELGEDRVAELYLATACEQGVPAALRLFDARFLAPLRAAVARIDARPSFVDDVLQSARARLFVGTEGRPGRVAEFTGRGSLASWLKVVVTRMALDERGGPSRREQPSSDDPVLDGPATSLPDFATERHAQLVRLVLEQALTSLPARERELLRLRFVADEGLDAIAVRFGVHRATVVRWLALCREGVLGEVRRLLGDGFGLGLREADDLCEDVASRFDLTLSRVLRPMTV